MTSTTKVQKFSGAEAGPGSGSGLSPPPIGDDSDLKFEVENKRQTVPLSRNLSGVGGGGGGSV